MESLSRKENCHFFLFFLRAFIVMGEEEARMGVALSSTFEGRNWRHAQILASECRVPLKGPGLLGKMVGSKNGAWKVQGKSGIMPENKEELRE